MRGVMLLSKSLCLVVLRVMLSGVNSKNAIWPRESFFFMHWAKKLINHFESLKQQVLARARQKTTKKKGQQGRRDEDAVRAHHRLPLELHSTNDWDLPCRSLQDSNPSTSLSYGSSYSWTGRILWWIEGYLESYLWFHFFIEYSLW